MEFAQQTLTKPLPKGMTPATRIFHPENSKYVLKQVCGRLNQDITEYKSSSLFTRTEIQILDVFQVRLCSYLSQTVPEYKNISFKYIQIEREVVGLLGVKVSSLYKNIDPSQEVSFSSFVDQIETVLNIYQNVYKKRMDRAHK